MRTEELLDEAKKHILYVADRPDVVMSRGRGVRLYDTDGKEYLDFVAGWAVNALGHSPKCIRKALDRQCRELVNSSPSFYNIPMVEFTSYLSKISGFARVFLCSIGAEANESAIKLARKFGSKNKNGAYKIVCVKGGFHGRTLATMSATGKENWKNLFEPKVPGFIHVPLNDVEALDAACSDDVCAVMLELIQGEGGVREADKKYVEHIRRLCDERNMLLIVDEVQTGLGRTGRLFCFEHYGVRPDVMTLAKGIGGGFPLAAMLCTEALNIFDKGEQGGTYTGQPLACAVGLAVVKEIVESDLSLHSAFMGDVIVDELKRLSRKYHISDIRGRGLLVAFDFDSEIAPLVVKEAFTRGLLLNSPPSSPMSIRLMPPLIVKRKHVHEMIDKLERSIRAAYSSR